MKRHAARLLLLSIGLGLMTSMAGAAAPEVPARGPFQDVLGSLLEAIVANDRATFVGRGTPAFQTAMGEPQWKSLVQGMRLHLKQGYTLDYFGKLTQQGVDVQIYKLAFAGGRDDLLVKLVMTDGLVAGLWFQ